MLKVALCVLLAATLLPGQEKPEALDAEIIPVKVLTGDSFNRLVKLLSVFNTRFSADDKLRTIVVYAPKDVVAQMRRVIEQLDQPGSEAAIGRNIEMTLAFLRCSATAQPDKEPLPTDLEPVAKQLRAATRCKNVELWDVVPIHIQEGKETQQSFQLPLTVPGLPNESAGVDLHIRPESVFRKGSGRSVRFDHVKINFRIPHSTSPPSTGAGESAKQMATQFTYFQVGLDTAGDFQEGQKTVLGKLSGFGDEHTVFVVISLKVLD